MSTAGSHRAECSKHAGDRPCTAKARSPSEERRVAGMVKSAEEAERRRRRGSAYHSTYHSTYFRTVHGVVARSSRQYVFRSTHLEIYGEVLFTIVERRDGPRDPDHVHE